MARVGNKAISCEKGEVRISAWSVHKKLFRSRLSSDLSRTLHTKDCSNYDRMSANEFLTNALAWLCGCHELPRSARVIVCSNYRGNKQDEQGKNARSRKKSLCYLMMRKQKHLNQAVCHSTSGSAMDSAYLSTHNLSRQNHCQNHHAVGDILD